MTDRPDTAHLHWNERWSDDAGRADWLAPEPEVLAAVARIGLPPGAAVLDLGCGVGRHVLALAERGFTVSGLDGAPRGIAFASAQAAARGLEVSLTCCEMTELPYPDASFDFVLAWNVIYHGDRSVVARCLAEIRRVLRPGGFYQGTMLSKRNANCGLGVVRHEVSDKAHPHFYCDAAELIALFEGFEPLSLHDAEHAKPGSWHWHILAELRG